MNFLIKVLCVAMPLLSLELLGLQNAVAGSDVSMLLTDQQGKPLSNAVVYAETDKKDSNTNVLPAAIEQKNKQFMPLVTIVQTGASINFPNNDKVRHHVYSFSPAKTFELKLYSGRPSEPVVFDKPGLVTLGCNIHDQMLAFVYVVDTPYFAKTDAQGKALLNLPDGQYRLKAMHYASLQQNEVTEQALSVKGSQNVALKITINASAVVNR